MEGRDARHQPARREGDRGRKRDDRLEPLATQAADGLLEGVETVTQHGIEHAPLRRQCHAPGPAQEQPDAEPVLELPHLVTDRCRRHRQLLGGGLEAEVAGCGLESPQGGQGRQAATGAAVDHDESENR